MNQLKTRMLFVPAVLLCASTALPVLAGMPIADLAPKNALIVIGVDDSKAMWESFDKTGLKAVWDEPEFKAWFDKHAKEAMDDFAGDLAELGIKTEELKRPTGPMGAAVWFEEGAQAENEEPAPPAIMLAADYADEAESMNEVVTRALEKSKTQHKIELSEKEHNGVTVYIVKPVEAAKGAENDEDAEMDGNGGGPLADQPMHYARVDGSLLLTTTIGAMEHAIDRLKGDKGPSVDEVEDFTAVRSQLGSAQGYGVLLAAPAREFMQRVAAQEAKGGEGDSGQMLMSMLKPLGLDEIKALAMGVTFDTDDAMLEQKYALLVPNKTGLPALFDAPAVRFEPPSFVASDAAGVTMFQFNFPGVVPLANQVVQALPDEMQQEIGGMVMGITMSMGPILANLGPEVWIVDSYTRPFSATSETRLFVIKVRDADAVQQAFAGVSPMMGLESRDFQGNQIWSPGGGGGMIPEGAFAMGLGFGHVFLGPTTSVENAMRLAGAKDNPTLASEKAFKDAVAVLDTQGVAYSYADMSTLFDWFAWYGKNIEKVITEQVKQQWGDEEPADDEERRWRQEAIDGALKSIPTWMKDPPPMHLLKKHIGDSVAQFKSTSQGYTGRALILRAKE